MMQLSLPRSERDRVLAHAVACYPGECCGFLVGRWNPAKLQVVLARPVVNLASRPDRYRIAPEAILAADTAARRQGLDVVAFYHSHPDGEPVPSETDGREGIPGTVHLILSLGSRRRSEFRAWRLDAGGGFTSIDLHPGAEALA